MPTYLSPGVYVEEIPSGSKPIEGVATSVAAFIGSAERGPTGTAELINSWDDYVSEYGSIASEDDAMGLAVQAYYLNGGKTAYVARLVADDPQTAPARSDVTGQDAAGASVIEIRALNPGKWGNEIYYRIIKPDPNALEFDLEIGHQSKGKFVRDELYADLTMNHQDEDYILTQVNGNSRYVEIVLKDPANPDKAGNLYQVGALKGGEILFTFAEFIASSASADFADVLSMTLNINGLGAKLISIDKTGLSDFGAVATAVRSAVQGLGPEPAYQGFVCGFDDSDTDAPFFELTSGEAGPESSVDVYDGDRGRLDLARALGVDSSFRATIIGAAVPDDTGGGTPTEYLSSTLTDTKTLTINVDGYGIHDLDFDTSAWGLTDDKASNGATVARAIREAVQALNPAIISYRGFDCQFEDDATGNDVFRMTSGGGSSRGSSLAVSGALADDLMLTHADAEVDAGRRTEHGTARVIPVQILGEGIFEEGLNLSGGGAVPPSALDYQNFLGRVLRKIRDVTLIILPGEQWASDGSGNPKIAAALAHCERTRSRMVFIDPPLGVELEQAAQVNQFALPTSTYSMLYYPWVKVANPFFNPDTNPNVEKTITIAPSAFAAGMMSKIDGKRGVWKAPAGVEAALIGVAGMEYNVEEGEQDQLNPLGVNCYRKMPGYGSVIWGSRTLSTKADPEWRYVPVRRTAIYLEQSIYNGIQWAVFEPNDHRLWASLRNNIESFMDMQFRAGAFQGEKASDGYHVRCGLGDTMTQDDINAGQVIVIVGFAPLKPAEFVIIRIQQKVGKQ